MQFFRLVRQFVLVETVDLQGLDTLLQNGALLRLKLFLRLALRILGIFIVLYFIYILYEFNVFEKIFDNNCTLGISGTSRGNFWKLSTLHRAAATNLWTWVQRFIHGVQRRSQLWTKTEIGSTDVTFNGSHADNYMASKPKVDNFWNIQKKRNVFSSVELPILMKKKGS